MITKVFRYGGYKIPEDLVTLTGGGVDNWKRVSDSHVEMYRQYTPINDDDFILEIGCGVGRDAIELSKMLSKNGKYIGIDIIKPSIEWCKKNITPKHSNFKFIYYDIKSQIHNGGGKINTTDIKLPIKDGAVDRIILHSVFTHMFENDIVHYLQEFRRVLKSDGLVLASFFIIDDHAIKSLQKNKNKIGLHPLSFEHKINKGCFINDVDHPEGAVGYTPRRIKSMLRRTGFGIHGQHAHRGLWSGLRGANGQDIFVLEKVNHAQAILQSKQKLIFTTR